MSTVEVPVRFIDRPPFPPICMSADGFIELSTRAPMDPTGQQLAMMVAEHVIRQLYHPSGETISAGRVSA